MAFTVDGSNGLTFPDSTTMASATQLGLRNRIINGAMMIDQRNAGASVTNNTDTPKYITDRFFCQGQNSDGVFTAQQSTTAPAGFINSLLITVTTADTSLGASQVYQVVQPIEGVNVADLAWGTASAKTVTLSFWVRSSLTGTFGGALFNASANRSYPFSYSINSANTFEYKTITITGDTSGTWGTGTGVGVYVIWSLGAGSTLSGAAGAWAGAQYNSATGATNLMATNGATFYITGVQLERGSAASPFDWRPYGTELALCQRYFEKSYTISVVPGTAGAVDGQQAIYMSGASSFFNGGGNSVSFASEKRAIPTITTYSGTTGASGKMRDYVANADVNSNVAYASTRSYFGYASVTQASSINTYWQWTASAEL